MLKFGICAGICFEWMVGSPVNSLHSLGSASIRALMAALLAWIALEALQAIWRSVMLLDDRPSFAPDGATEGTPSVAAQRRRRVS